MSARAWVLGLVVLGACGRATPRGAGGDAPYRPIRIDGRFDDWAGAPVAFTSTVAPASGADLLDVSVRDDAQYVYLRLRFASETSLMGLDGTLEVLLDGDDRPATGPTIAGLRGADLQLEFSPRDSVGRPVQGARLRTHGAGLGPATTDIYALDLMVAPSYASREFEVRLARGRATEPGSATTFAGDGFSAQVVVRNARGEPVDGGGVFRVGLRTGAAAGVLPAQPTDPLARASGTDLRVLQWNMADRGLIERPEPFRRIIAALEPDVLVLDEVSGDLGAAALERFLASLDSGRTPQAGWHFTYGGGGGYQRTVVASRNGVTEYPPFRRIAFPDSVVRAVVELTPEPTRKRLLDNIALGVATGGAEVRTGERRLAVIGFDLQSAGNGFRTWQDTRRRAEAAIVHATIEEALGAAGGADGLVVAGDANLVGTRAALDILTAPYAALDGEGLVPVDAYQLDKRTAATWDGGEGPFPPGRLDFILYSPRRLEVRRAFAFETRDLRPEWLRVHRVDAGDSRRASDHLPLVADLRWVR